MDKKLIQNIDEYRQWAWDLYIESNENYHVEQCLGLEPIHDCWDSIENEDGSFTDFNEDGSVIVPDTAETVELQQWVTEIKFPCIFIYLFEDTWDRFGSVKTYILDYISIEDFTVTTE
ncbi:hypothetical protein SCRM01_202 [Synechococcus phage S-CRM01]|uniref:hypothetical protein n=1 Tax=Synechococcus phage S-CRM01 TaxID=1026955 RepID=UPI000209E41B|nr:hypothetical protein SCRM01_202 [Synechococcus phage S-CRM01]AEC53148.1 hypothetical protein SCRM01_202 [Synechococcus phage S-CRM01]